MGFRGKLLLSTVLLLALAFGIGGSVFLTLSFSGSLEQEKDAALRSYEMVQGTLGLVNQVSDQTSVEDVVDVLTQMDSQGLGDWLTLRVTGEELHYQTSGQYAALLQDLTGETGEGQGVSRLFGVGDRRYYQITSPFAIGKETCYLDGLYDLTAVYTLRQRQQEIYFQVFWVVILAGGLTAWAMAALLTRPLLRLSQATQALAGGELATRAPVRGEDEIAGLARDFNRMADSIQNYVHQLQENLERQEEFMGSFAHELKTPMTSIIGYADLIRSQTLTEEELGEAANYIFQEGTRLEHLSLTLLELLVLRRDRFDLVETDLPQLARQVKGAMGPIAKKYALTFRAYAKPGSARMEPELVKSLIFNLLDNGRKAMDGPGGELILALEPAEGGGCKILVWDNGRGFPPGEADRLTEAFYRVDKSRSRAQGGAGLGLALCREIVAIHRGTLTFRSQPGQGTMVTVTLKGGDADEKAG